MNTMVPNSNPIRAPLTSMSPKPASLKASPSLSTPSSAPSSRSLRIIDGSGNDSLGYAAKKVRSPAELAKAAQQAQQGVSRFVAARQEKRERPEGPELHVRTRQELLAAEEAEAKKREPAGMGEEMAAKREEKEQEEKQREKQEQVEQVEQVEQQKEEKEEEEDEEEDQMADSDGDVSVSGLMYRNGRIETNHGRIIPLLCLLEIRERIFK